MSFDRIIYRLTDKRIPAATGILLSVKFLNVQDFRSSSVMSDQIINVPANRLTAAQ